MADQIDIVEICEVCNGDVIIDGQEFDCPYLSCLKYFHSGCASTHLESHVNEEEVQDYNNDIVNPTSSQLFDKGGPSTCKRKVTDFTYSSLQQISL